MDMINSMCGYTRRHIPYIGLVKSAREISLFVMCSRTTGCCYYRPQ